MTYSNDDVIGILHLYKRACERLSFQGWDEEKIFGLVMREYEIFQKSRQNLPHLAIEECIDMWLNEAARISGEIF